MGDFLSPKRRDVVDRLRRRLELYRRRQNGCHQRYEFGQKHIYEQERQAALLLRQKYLDSKAKNKSKNKTKAESGQPDHRNQIVTVSFVKWIVLTHVFHPIGLRDKMPLQHKHASTLLFFRDVLCLCLFDIYHCCIRPMNVHNICFHVQMMRISCLNFVLSRCMLALGFMFYIQEWDRPN